MHAPRSYGRFVEDEELSSADVAAVSSLAARLTNFKQVSELDSLRWKRVLPSGRVAVLKDMGGVFKIHVYEQDEGQEWVQQERKPLSTYVPMLFCGVVLKSIVRGDEGVELQLTPGTARRLTGYASAVSERQKLQRFRIEYSARHKEFEPNPPSMVFTHTQYAQLRPTWFSGRMATLVQIVGGYGRQDFASLPRTQVEQAQYALPKAVAKAVVKELGEEFLMPGCSGYAPDSGEIQYDYKFMETHAVSFAGPGQPWLIRISGSGVFAMPLPMAPATTTEAFKQHVIAKGDTELEWVLEKFGGMPTGEGFPKGAADFEAWRRAGVILKLCDTADFYSKSPYSSTIGWSFNTAGTEGVNTCYEFGDDGIQIGYAYQLSLRLPTVRDGGRLPKRKDWGSADDSIRIHQYLAKLEQEMQRSRANTAAIRYKLRRASSAELRARAMLAGTWSGERELIYWDNFEAQPIGSGSGNISVIGEGKLWAPGKPAAHPQIKFPEPYMQGCVSHDFGRLEGSPPPSPEPRCDTIMYAYYAEDELKVVKYFREPRSYEAEVVDNYDECMTVGSWQRTVTEGSTSLMGNFYTTDLDERKAAAPITTVTNTVGTDLGYDSKPHFGFDDFFSMVGSIWRNRYFKHKVNSERIEGYGLSVAVCIPYLERNAALLAKRESTTSGSKTESVAVYSITDPNSYRMRTYDFIFAWVSGPHDGNVATVNGFSPYPKDGNPVWVLGYNYNPSICSDFADQGDWMGGLPQDYTWLVHPNRMQWNHSGGGGAPKVKEYGITTPEKSKTTGELMLSIYAQPSLVKKDPENGYFLISPSEFGDVFYKDAVKSAAGESTYANCSESDAEATYQRKRWGFTRLADHKSAHHFIGVINE